MELFIRLLILVPFRCWLVSGIFLNSYLAVCQGDTTYFVNDQNQFTSEGLATTKWSRLVIEKGKWSLVQEKRVLNEWKTVQTSTLSSSGQGWFEEVIQQPSQTVSTKYQLTASQKGGYEVQIFHSTFVEYGYSSHFFPLRKEGIWTCADSLGGTKFKESLCVGGWSNTSNYFLPDGQELRNVFTFVDEDPEFDFSGGFNAFIKSQVKFPPAALHQAELGRVFVSFFITDQGDVVAPEILKGIGFGCDEEALRVIRLSQGKWKPGKVKGKPVHMRMVVPFHFKR